MVWFWLSSPYEEKGQHFVILSMYSYRCSIHVSFFAFIILCPVNKWANKEMPLYLFTLSASCLWSSSCKITKHVRQTASTGPPQATRNYSLANSAVQIWPYTCHLVHFYCQGLLHCWANPPNILIHCLLCSLPQQNMCCNLTVNI